MSLLLTSGLRFECVVGIGRLKLFRIYNTTLCGIQVGADNVVKIADFGISKFVQGAEQRLHEQV